MRLAVLACASILLVGPLSAQNAAAPPAMQHDKAMAGMPDQHMQEMKAQVEQMRATLNDMKANSAGIKDSTAKRQAQLDTQLWERMVAHLEGMVNMMSSHAAGDHSTACCGGMMGVKAGGGAGMASHNCCSDTKDGMKDGKAGMSCCGEGGMSCAKPAKPGADSLHEHNMEPPSR